MFASLAARHGHLPANPRIIKACFKVKFADSKNPRSVKIRPGNIAEYMRDSDAVLIEQWLELRGFILHEEASHQEAPATSMDGN